MSNTAAPSIAVIGAGMAGISCARHLRSHGLRPTIFEKSRGLGGRLATRRLADGATFDHGAQYLKAHSAAFRIEIEKAIEAGVADHWRPKTLKSSATSVDGWIVGTPAMNALVKPLADGIDIRLAATVTAVAREGNSWRIDTAGNNAGELFDILVCTAPAPQARVLLASEPAIASALARVSMAPCWALMLTLADPLHPGFDVCEPASGGLSWIARNTSKPNRRAAKDDWVIHASPAWSRRHLELDREQAAARMLEMVSRAVGGPLPKIEHVVAHRWRYALTTAPLGEPFLRSEDGSLFVGGDWCLGARVEYAFDSGRAIAQALVGAAQDRP